jgi:hypothetical protein
MTLQRHASTIAILIAIGVGTADAADRTDMASQLRMARSWGPVIAHRVPPAAQGTGMLVADFHPLGNDWRSGSDYFVELGPSTGGTAQRFPMQVGRAGVFELDAGRYCVVAVERAGERFEGKCEPPFYDVSADSVDVTGRVEITLRRKRAEVASRVIDGSYVEAPLSDSDLTDVASYLESAESRGKRTFFVSAPPQLRFIARLTPDGIAEIENFSLANSSYERGTWSARGEGFDLRFDSGNRTYRLDADSGSWLGKAAMTSGYTGLTFRTVRHLAVSTLPQCWHWLRCGTRWPRGVIWEMDYTFVPDAGSLVGRIEFEFMLKARAGVTKPHDVDVVSSALSREQTKNVLKNFADTIFSTDGTTVPTQRYRQSIEFRRDGDELVAIPGELMLAE